MAETLVRGRRLEIRYAVGRGHHDLGGVELRLRPAVERALPAALLAAAAMVGPERAAGSGGVWLIQRLELDLALRAGWQPDTIARAWVPRVARSLAHALEADGVEVFHFARAGDHLARFLTEAVAGTAAQRWYLRSFAPLRPLPLSAAARIALCADPSAGFEALAVLASSTLGSLLERLGSGDARAVLDALTTGPPERVTAEQVAAAASAQMALAAPRDAAGEQRMALRLTVETRRTCGRPPTPGSTRAARAIARLACVAARDDPSAAAVRRAIDTAEPTLLAAVLDDEDVTFAATVAQGLGRWNPPVGRGAPPAQSASRGAHPRIRHTAFGALFFLLPELAQLDVGDLTAWPGGAGCDPATALRALIALRSLGPCAEALADPVVRDVLGLGHRVDAAALARWLGALRPPHARGLAALAATPPFALSAPVAVLASVAAPAAPVALVVDAESAHWLGARGLRRGGLVAWARTVAGGELLAADPAITPGLAAAEDDPRPDVYAVLARLSALPGDLRVLAPPTALRGPREIDLTLRVLAQRCLRGAARRMPAIARSSLPYLHHNVLDVGARVEEHDDRTVVTLGRPPLDVLVSMTGLARATLRLPWQPDSPPMVLTAEAPR